MRLILLLVLLCAAFAAQADHVYRWVDAQGHVHYSDSPPPEAQNIQSSGVETQDTDPDAIAARKARKQATDEARAKQAEVQKKLDDIKHQEAEQKARQCLAARKRVEQLAQAMRHRQAYTTDAQGNRHYLSEEERRARYQKARQEADAACY